MAQLLKATALGKGIGMADDFWAEVKAQYVELMEAQSAADVTRILSHERNPYGANASSQGDGFYAGSGGEHSVLDALYKAGWTVKWMQAAYYYAMTAPNGDIVTYIEGDIYGRDCPPI